jgi:hypothetical protein
MEQRVLLLEEPEKRTYVEKGEKEQIAIIYATREREQIPSLLAWADVVVVSWWNHPAMAKFLAQWQPVPCRAVLWCHVNGCVYPYLPYDFAMSFEKVLITTDYSLKNPLWTENERTAFRKKACLIHGMGDFSPEQIEAKRDYGIAEHFVAGYAGTINYTKIHPKYIEYCESAIQRIPNIHFLMVGDADQDILREVHQRGIEAYFTFTGHQEDIYPCYRKMDVLVYLLREDNYATTENVILEALACGVPVIAYRNPPEESILTQQVTGFLIGSQEEYLATLYQLSTQEDLRRQMGQQGRDYVIQSYSAEENCRKFLEETQQVCRKERRLYSFAQLMGEQPYDWFCAFTGYDKEFFVSAKERSQAEWDSFLNHCPAIYKGMSKGSILHFAGYYPEDYLLKEWGDEVKRWKELHREG